MISGPAGDAHTSEAGASVVAVVLAAGAGSRYGGPKALAHDAAGRAWVRTVVETLTAAGIGRVVVVLGAGAGRAVHLVPGGAEVVIAREWESGPAASLRAGLEAVERGSGPARGGRRAEAVLVALVDQPSLPGEIVDQLLSAPVDSRTLRRMTYAGRPGHPVLIGRDHWQTLRVHWESSAGAGSDSGAGPWLATQDVEVIAGDAWWDGVDIDRPPR